MLSCNVKASLSVADYCGKEHTHASKNALRGSALLSCMLFLCLLLLHGCSREQATGKRTIPVIPAPIENQSITISTLPSIELKPTIVQPLETEASDQRRLIDEDGAIGLVKINRNLIIPEAILQDNNDTVLQRGFVVSHFSSINSSVEQNLDGRKIAVILPFSNPKYASVAKEFRQGIMKLYLQRGYTLQINFIDSYEYADIAATYDDLVEQDYDAVLGPLLPQIVNQIRFSEQVINLPFNQPRQPLPSSSNISIELSLHNQWQQMVDFADAAGACNAIVFIDSRSSSADADKLVDAWFKLGHNIDNLVYLDDNINDNSNKIKQTMTFHPSLEELEVDADGRLQKNFQAQDDFPFIRQDVDVIFSFLSLDQNRTLSPVLNLVGGELPLMVATSKMTRSTQFNPIVDQDLAGINYIDIPWRYSQSNLTLFEAMGYDALLLSLHLKSGQDFHYSGLSGRYVHENKQLRKSLHWYKHATDQATLIN